MSTRQKKLTPEVMQELRNKPGPMPLKIADILWPEAVMPAQVHLDKVEGPLLPDFLAVAGKSALGFLGPARCLCRALVQGS
jgi:hypothetical protein